MKKEYVSLSYGALENNLQNTLETIVSVLPLLYDVRSWIEDDAFNSEGSGTADDNIREAIDKLYIITRKPI